jgi:hypothetical protein
MFCSQSACEVIFARILRPVELNCLTCKLLMEEYLLTFCVRWS